MNEHLETTTTPGSSDPLAVRLVADQRRRHRAECPDCDCDVRTTVSTVVVHRAVEDPDGVPIGVQSTPRPVVTSVYKPRRKDQQ